MDFDTEIYSISNDFFNDYPPTLYPEILFKPSRPYHCLLIDTHIGYFICIPYRTNIAHNNAYKFKSSNRSKQHRSGLDYTKMLIIRENKYLSSNVIVDNDEYKETMLNLNRIVRESNTYLKTYINHITGISPLNPKGFARKYEFSTLPYFHDILGIDNNDNKESAQTNKETILV